MNDQKTTPTTRKVQFQRAQLTSAKRQARVNSRMIRSEQKETAQNSFMTVLFIVLFVVFAGFLGTIQPPANMSEVATPELSQNYISSISGEVGTIALGSIEFVLTIIRPIADTIQFVVTSFGSIVNGLLSFIGWFYEPIVDYDIRDTADPTIICTTYDSLPFTQKVNYTSNRLWHNLWNEPDIQTNEAWHIYLQRTKYGTEAYNEVCNA